MHVFQYQQKFRRTCGHPRFAENTLANYNFNVRMFYHVTAVISMRLRAIGSEGAHCYPSPYHRPSGLLGPRWEEVWTGSHSKLLWTTCPAQSIAVLLTGEVCEFAIHWEMHSLNQRLERMCNWYLHEAGGKAFLWLWGRREFGSHI